MKSAKLIRPVNNPSKYHGSLRVGVEENNGGRKERDHARKRPTLVINWVIGHEWRGMAIKNSESASASNYSKYLEIITTGGQINSHRTPWDGNCMK